MGHHNTNNMTYPSPPQPMYVQPTMSNKDHNSMPPPPPPISSPSSEFDNNSKTDKRPNLRVHIPNESPEPSSIQPLQVKKIFYILLSFS